MGQGPNGCRKCNTYRAASYHDKFTCELNFRDDADDEADEEEGEAHEKVAAVKHLIDFVVGMRRRIFQRPNLLRCVVHVPRIG